MDRLKPDLVTPNLADMIFLAKKVRCLINEFPQITDTHTRVSQIFGKINRLIERAVNYEFRSGLSFWSLKTVSFLVSFYRLLFNTVTIRSLGGLTNFSVLNLIHLVSPDFACSKLRC